jgi:hypothetical protein
MITNSTNMAVKNTTRESLDQFGNPHSQRRHSPKQF